MRSSNRETVPVGKVVGVHGIKGEIKVLPYGGLDFEWKTVYLKGKGSGSTCRVKRARAHKGAIIIELEGLQTRNDAERLVGLEVEVDRGSLPELPEGEYYYFQLMGMEVVADDGRALGKITNIFSTGSNDVLQAEGPFGEVLIPALEDTIVKVDISNGRLVIHMMEGLLPGEGER
ncbi:MAG: 16S rRNA processing protein RimM [Deltaproteobacteria bacterium]|nr:16S rRNA processing protein RimM [Deltaproteobacteria bacterium]